MFSKFYMHLEGFLYHSLLIMILLYSLYAYNQVLKQIRMKQEGKQKPHRRKTEALPALIQKSTSKQLLCLDYMASNFHYEVSIHNSGANTSSKVLFADELIPSLFLDQIQTIKKAKRPSLRRAKRHLFCSGAFKTCQYQRSLYAPCARLIQYDPLSSNGKV